MRWPNRLARTKAYYVVGSGFYAALMLLVFTYFSTPSLGGTTFLVVVGSSGLAIVAIMAFNETGIDTWACGVTLVYCVAAMVFGFSWSAWSLSETQPSGCSIEPVGEKVDHCAFTEQLSKTDALYFVTATITTTGYGDIAPVSQAARGYVTAMQMAGFGALVLGVSLFVSRLKPEPSPGQCRPPTPNI